MNSYVEISSSMLPGNFFRQAHSGPTGIPNVQCAKRPPIAFRKESACLRGQQYHMHERRTTSPEHVNNCWVTSPPPCPLQTQAVWIVQTFPVKVTNLCWFSVTKGVDQADFTLASDGQPTNPDYRIHKTRVTGAHPGMAKDGTSRSV